jgi:hypothetical protein
MLNKNSTITSLNIIAHHRKKFKQTSSGFRPSISDIIAYMETKSNTQATYHIFLLSSKCYCCVYKNYPDMHIQVQRSIISAGIWAADRRSEEALQSAELVHDLAQLLLAQRRGCEIGANQGKAPGPPGSLASAYGLAANGIPPRELLDWRLGGCAGGRAAEGAKPPGSAASRGERPPVSG